MFEPRIKRSCLVVSLTSMFLFGVFLLSSCARINQAIHKDQGGEVTAGATSGKAAVVQQGTSYAFPDVPVPIELKKVEDKTLTISTPGFHGGIVVLKGRVTPDSLVNFFQKTMPEYGWRQVGSLTAKRSFLAFSKHNSGHCLIQIYQGPMGFETEVQIWIAEPASH